MSASPARSNHARLFLTFAFGLLALLLAVRVGIIVKHEESVRAEVESIVRNTMESIQLVDRIAKNVEHEHLLQEAHIRTNKPEQLAVIEKQLAAVRADYLEAAAAFEALPANPEEGAIWTQLRAKIAELHASLDEVRSSSRANRDREAQAALDAMERQYTEVGELASALTHVDDMEASTTLSRVASLQDSLIRLSLLLGGLGVLATLLIGGSAIYVIGRREKDLEARARELEQRNQELDAFAGRVAHDFRGPIATLNVATSRLSRRFPEEHELSRPFQKAVSRMESLIRDLLSLSRIDNVARTERCNPQPIVAELQQELRPKLDATGASLHVDVEASVVQCSDGLLRQALWNLAENALNYGRPGVPTEVEISGRVKGQHYELRVSDNGVGIAEEDQRHVFDPFYRGSRTAERPGTGLGLSIVKRVVEANEGTIAVASQPGRGTTFVMNLPLSAEDRPAPRFADSEPPSMHH